MISPKPSVLLRIRMKKNDNEPPTVRRSEGLGGGVHSEVAQWVEVPAAKPGKLSSIRRTLVVEGESMAVSCPLPLCWYPSHLARIQSKNMNVILKRKKKRLKMWTH